MTEKTDFLSSQPCLWSDLEKNICFLEPIILIWHSIRYHLGGQESKTDNCFIVSLTFWKLNVNKCFVYVLFPGQAILRFIFTSGILQAQLLLEISLHSADACILGMSCVDYSRAAKNPFLK